VAAEQPHLERADERETLPRRLPVFFVVYAGVTSDVDILKWAPTVGWISDSLSLLLVIVAGFVPGKPASIEIAAIFD
jgi:hypothetical protein